MLRLVNVGFIILFSTAGKKTECVARSHWKKRLAQLDRRLYRACKVRRWQLGAIYAYGGRGDANGLVAITADKIHYLLFSGNNDSSPHIALSVETTY